MYMSIYIYTLNKYIIYVKNLEKNFNNKICKISIGDWLKRGRT